MPAALPKVDPPMARHIASHLVRPGWLWGRRWARVRTGDRTFSADGGPGMLSAEDGLATFLATGTTIMAGMSLHSMLSKLLFSGRWLDTPPSSSSTRALPNSSRTPPTASLLPTTGDLSWSDAFQPLALLMILSLNLANRLGEL